VELLTGRREGEAPAEPVQTVVLFAGSGSAGASPASPSRLERTGMKRKTFRLGSVLRVYELRKQRAEMDLRQASRLLHDIETEITALGVQIATVAALVHDGKVDLSAAGWLACYRKTEQLDRQRDDAHARRDRQVETVKKLEEQRKKWAVAEETLLSLRHNIETENRVEAAKAQQLQLDETVLRRWQEVDSIDVHD
jgi:flagellar biosynthesis chaperone FliJ